MTIYEEMQNLAQSLRLDWNNANDRCIRYMSEVIFGFIEYAGIPDEQITFMRKVEEEDGKKKEGEEIRYREAADRKKYTLPGAVLFSENDGYWHLGLAITLSKSGVFPPVWYGFVLRLKEDGKNVLIKTGLEQKVWRVASEELRYHQQLFESLAEKSLELIRQRREITPKGIGFLAE